MTDYEFTDAEQAAIEAAAHEQLSTVMVDRDAEEAAYGIAEMVRGPFQDAAFRQAEALLRGHGLDEAAAWMDYYASRPREGAEALEATR